MEPAGRGASGRAAARSKRTSVARSHRLGPAGAHMGIRPALAKVRIQLSRHHHHAAVLRGHAVERKPDAEQRGRTVHFAQRLQAGEVAVGNAEIRAGFGFRAVGRFLRTACYPAENGRVHFAPRAEQGFQWGEESIDEPPRPAGQR